MSSPVYVTAFCDASFCTATSAAAWAVWIKGPKGTFLKAYTFRVPMIGPTAAEKCAAVNTLAIVRKMYAGVDAVCIVLQCDCKDVLMVIDGLSIGKRKASRDLNKLVKAEVERVKALGWSIKTKHVKGHSGIGNPRSAVNHTVDKLARKQMKVVRSSLVGVA